MLTKTVIYTWNRCHHNKNSKICGIGLVLILEGVAVVNGHLLWKLEDANQSYAGANHLGILPPMIVYKVDLIQNKLVALDEGLNRKLKSLQIDVSCSWQRITKMKTDDLRK